MLQCNTRLNKQTILVVVSRFDHKLKILFGFYLVLQEPLMLLDKLVFMLSAEFSVMLGNFCTPALFLPDRLPIKSLSENF